MSAEAVSRAIAKQRLVQSVVYVDGVPKIADPELADREWAANTDLSRAPASVKDAAAAAEAGSVECGEDPETRASALATASAEEKRWKAKLAELNYKQRSGELVNAAEMEAAIADAFSTVRTKLLGLPAKAKQQLPHLTLNDLATLDAIVREALESLARAEAEAA